LTNLAWLSLAGNNLDLTSGSLDMMDIEALQDRGVEVEYYLQD